MSYPFPFLCFLLLFFPASNFFSPSSSIVSGSSPSAVCGTAGSIERGSSATLDANSDGYFSSYTGSGFTVTSNEFLEFEDLTGIGGANKGWTRLGGSDPNSDLSAGGGCGNTDIVTDLDGGSDYAYYSIIDPNGTADSGDEYMAFALRISNKINGAFGFTFLLDSDNNCGSSDGNSVCGNPCFEYEIQLTTSNSGGIVNLYTVDGCYGTADCNTAHGSSAVVCEPCNSEGLQVCAGSSACGSGDPVFWVYYINFSDIPGVNSTTSFSLTPASNTSGNQVIYKSANVSDYGGIDDINDINGACDCSTVCSGNPCSKCSQDCALSCAAESNSLNEVLPVDFLSFDSDVQSDHIRLNWAVAESYPHNGYYIERATERMEFHPIDWIPAAAESGLSTYSYQDYQYEPGFTYYRILQVDFDGMSSYSPVIAVHMEAQSAQITYQAGDSWVQIDEIQSVNVYGLNGQAIYQRDTNSGPRIRLPKSLFPVGLYIINGIDASGQPFSRKLMIPF